MHSAKDKQLTEACKARDDALIFMKVYDDQRQIAARAGLIALQLIHDGSFIQKLNLNFPAQLTRNRLLSNFVTAQTAVCTKFILK